MDTEQNNALVDTKITEEQAEAIAKDLDEFVKGTDTEAIQNLPSNQGVETRETEPEEGESKVINIQTNPLTGENVILNTDEVEVSDEDANERLNKISIDDLTRSATEEEITEAMQEDGVLKEISKDIEWTSDEIKQILDVTNRKIKRENFNVFKALPESVQVMINNYIQQELGISTLAGAKASQVNYIRNTVAENIIDQFQNDITLNRAKHDFAHELASIYHSGTKSISESAVDYTDTRNKEYREAAEKMEDPEKRERMLAILDRIDAARSLDELKEFAKKCKVKSIEVEKPKRVIGSLMSKYEKSANNIYAIDLCKYTLGRNLPERTDTEIMCFFIVFCKYVMNWDINIPLNHAFIYYVLYYCALLDGDKSDIFKNNVREVIDNIKTRNPGIEYGTVSEEELQAKLKEYEEMMKAAKKYDEEADAEETDEESDIDDEEDIEEEDIDEDEDDESEEESEYEYENDEEDDLIEEVENEDIETTNEEMPQPYSYRGFTQGLYSRGPATLPAIMAIPDNGGTPIAVMTFEEVESLPENTREETFQARFREIVDAYYAKK